MDYDQLYTEERLPDGKLVLTEGGYAVLLQLILNGLFQHGYTERQSVAIMIMVAMIANNLPMAEYAKLAERKITPLDCRTKNKTRGPRFFDVNNPLPEQEMKDIAVSIFHNLMQKGYTPAEVIAIVNRSAATLQDTYDLLP